MTPAQLQLARELAAHPRFQWRSGMLALYTRAPGSMDDGRKRLDTDDYNPTADYDIARNSDPDGVRRAWPDLTDAATGGVLWEMAGRPEVHYTYNGHGVRFFRVGPGPAHPNTERPNEPCGSGEGSTLAETCARALLAVWAADAKGGQS